MSEIRSHGAGKAHTLQHPHAAHQLLMPPLHLLLPRLGRG